MLVCEEIASLKNLPERMRKKIILKPSTLKTLCWCWTGRLNRNGYAYIWCYQKKREVVGHRICYEMACGFIPDGYILDHLCRVRACINPWHTEPVTHRENTLRGDAVLFSKDIYQ